MLEEVISEHEDELAGIQVTTVDVLSEPEAVIRYGILSTPALAINGKLRSVGVPKRSELLRMLTEEAGEH
jgi:thioredoxin family protein